MSWYHLLSASNTVSQGAPRPHHPLYSHGIRGWGNRELVRGPAELESTAVWFQPRHFSCSRELPPWQVKITRCPEFPSSFLNFLNHHQSLILEDIKKYHENTVCLKTRDVFLSWDRRGIILLCEETRVPVRRLEPANKADYSLKTQTGPCSSQTQGVWGSRLRPSSPTVAAHRGLRTHGWNADCEQDSPQASPWGTPGFKKRSLLEWVSLCGGGRGWKQARQVVLDHHPPWKLERTGTGATGHRAGRWGGGDARAPQRVMEGGAVTPSLCWSPNLENHRGWLCLQRVFMEVITVNEVAGGGTLILQD